MHKKEKVTLQPPGTDFSSVPTIKLLFFVLCAFLLIIPRPADARNLTCSRMPALMKGFLSNHYALTSLDEETRSHAVDQLIKNIDPSKTLLYESDIERFGPLLHDLFPAMLKGNCTSLAPLYNVLVTRAAENEEIVKKLLGSGYRPDESLELQIDARKRNFARTRMEKQILLKKFVQFQIENALINGVEPQQAIQKQIHHYELQTRRVMERDPEQMVTVAAEAFARALDPHTSYLSAESYEDLQIHMQLSLEGIGAVLSNDNGFTVIEEMIPGGGAEASGLLKPKDKIIAVAQENQKPVNVIDMDLRDVVRMIRGKKGTKVTLTILRQAQNVERFDITIIRDKINIKEQEASITYETRSLNGKTFNFGVIDLPSFYGDAKENRSSYEDVRKLLKEAKRQKVDGIVLDLSRNGGGLLAEAVQLTGLFLGPGGVVATKDKSGYIMVLATGVHSRRSGRLSVLSFPAENTGSVYLGPLVVLTSRLSASASEIVAGALKDYRRAVIVGSDHTFGKGSVQMLTPLPDNMGSMKVTTALYFLPGGKSTQKNGVEADVRLPFWFILEDVGEMLLDYSLPPQQIEPFLRLGGRYEHPWKQIEQSLISRLSLRSASRVAKDEQFLEIVKQNKEARGKDGLVRLKDLRTEVKSKTKANDQEQKQADGVSKKSQEQYKPFINESVNILLDMVTLQPASPTIQTRAGYVGDSSGRQNTFGQ
ncbi:MAG: S41 family peptidase [Smithellaceae bacterium]|jgi:carboxyl-terminal processing protease